MNRQIGVRAAVTNLARQHRIGGVVLRTNAETVVVRAATTSESAADIFAAFMNDADNFPAGSVPVVEWKLSEAPEHITMSAAVFACITMPATMKIGKNLSDDPGDAVSRSAGGSSRGF